MRRYSHIFPIFGFIVLEFILFIANYTPGTYLMGWDNLMPEFNFWANIQRNIFGVWQQYRGLGLFDGQSHAAAIVHTVFIGFLSLWQPQSLIRYTFTFGMHALGILGVFYLSKEFLYRNGSNKFPCVIAALFYGFNPATIQMFYTPFEPFTVHFAALPWIAYGLQKYFAGEKNSWRTLLLVLFTTTPQFFVPTLILPVGILVISFSLAHIRLWKTILVLCMGFFLVNTFWMAPYLAGLPSNAPVIENAKINLMSSNDIYTRNRAFGDAKNVMLLRGFPLAFEDFDQGGHPIHLMENWKTYLDIPTVWITSILFACLSITGFIFSLSRKNTNMIPWSVSGIIAFVFLAINSPITKTLNEAIRSAIPFLTEGLRVPFTKFIFLFVLAYSICIALAVNTLGKYVKNTSLFHQGLMLCVSLALCILAFPAFTGDFISPLMRVSFPTDYQQTFSYFQKQPTDARIALLPQHSYWSWKLYQYGYHGSGFLWFGLPQPLLDRAFDPWSTTNEQYYWELSYALYSKNIQLIDNILTKYDVSFIILDDHFVSFSNNRSLYIDETKELFAKMPTWKQDAIFGKITIYKRTGSTSTPFVSIKNNLSIVAPTYKWTNTDVTYTQMGDYVANTLSPITYPFRSLFTKRAVGEREFTIKESSTIIDINSIVIATSASILKSTLEVYDSATTTDLTAGNVKPCGLLKDGKVIASNSIESGMSFLRFTSLNQRACLSFDIPHLSHRLGYLVAVESKHVSGNPLDFALTNYTAKHTELETYLPDYTNIHTSYFILPPLAPDGMGYSVYVANDSIGTYTSVNDLGRIRIYQIPYEQMTTMHTGTFIRNNTLTNSVSVYHPNPAYYKVTLQNRSPIESGTTETIILSQSYDPGWIAWSGGILLPHVLVNNWENGWTIDPGTSGTIYIFFWPQLLEFLGFALLPIPFFFTCTRKHG